MITENDDELAAAMDRLSEALSANVAIDDMPDELIQCLHAVCSSLIVLSMEGKNDRGRAWIAEVGWTVGAEVMDEMRRRPSMRHLLERREEAWAFLRTYMKEKGF